MKRQHGLVPGVERIAVLRANALGDFIFTLPALQALRVAYPSAEIVLLARDWHEALLAGRPGPVDRVIPIPHGALGDEAVDLPRAARLAMREDVLAEIRRDRYDIAVQAHGGGRNSNPFLRAIGARVTVGAATPDAEPLDRSVPYQLFQHEILRALEIVALVGASVASTTDLEPRLEVTPADRAEAAHVVPEDGGPFVVLHPGASDPRRRWPAEQFAQIAEHVVAGGRRVVLSGSAVDHESLDAFQSAVEGIAGATRAAVGAPITDASGRLSLRGLVGLLSRADLVVSNDTGPLHVAAAVGARTTGIFWSGNLIAAGPLTRTRHRPLISWRMACPTCGADCMASNCEHRPSFVADVPFEAVRDAVDALLADAGAELRAMPVPDFEQDARLEPSAVASGA